MSITKYQEEKKFRVEYTEKDFQAQKYLNIVIVVTWSLFLPLSSKIIHTMQIKKNQKIAKDKSSYSQPNTYKPKNNIFVIPLSFSSLLFLILLLFMLIYPVKNMNYSLVYYKENLILTHYNYVQI